MCFFSVDATRIAAPVDEWKTAKVGLIYLTATNLIPKLENNHFVDRINAEVRQTHTELNRQKLDLLDDKVSFETQFTYWAAFFRIECSPYNCLTRMYVCTVVHDAMY